jgi:MFS family permease
MQLPERTLLKKKHFLLNTLHIIIDGLFDSVPILLSFMIISFGAGAKEAGVIISAANMLNTIAGLSTIYFSRCFGLFRTLSLAIFLYGIGFFTNAFSQDIFLAGLCFIIGNSGFVVFHNVAFTYLSSNSEKRLLGKTLGDFGAIGDIGRIPLASLAAFMAAFTIFGFPGWRAVCLAYGLAALLFAGYVFLSSAHEKNYRNTDVDREAVPEKFFPSFSILRSRGYVFSMSASVLDALGSNQVFTFLPFLLFSKGIDPKIMGAFAFAFTLGSFIGKTVLGRMVVAFGNRRVFITSELAMAALLLVLIIGEHLYTVIGSSLLLGVVTKGTVPVVQTIITEPAAGAHEYDNIFSINNFLRGIASIIAPLIFGFVASTAGISWSFSIMAVVIICAVIPVLMMNLEIAPKEICSEQ